MEKGIITSKSNDTVKFLASLKEKNVREQTGLFLLEGRRAVVEGIEAKAAERLIVTDTFSKTKEYRSINKNSLPVTILSEAMFQRISETKTPQGIAAICKIKKHDLQRVLKEEKDILLLEDVRDPGNMGTVIRTAAAAGFGAIVASDGCVDVYNPKVVRSTVGCIFKMKIIQCKGKFGDIADEIKHSGFKIFAAHPRGGKDLFKTDFQDKTAIALGNEANGLSEMMLRKCDGLVTISMEKGVESLNASVAAALMMYEVRRKKYK